MTVPALRHCAREFLARHKDVDHHTLWALIDAMWDSGYCEPRMVAVELLDMRSKLPGPGDMPSLEHLLRS